MFYVKSQPQRQRAKGAVGLKVGIYGHTISFRSDWVVNFTGEDIWERPSYYMTTKGDHALGNGNEVFLELSSLASWLSRYYFNEIFSTLRTLGEYFLINMPLVRSNVNKC